MATMRPWVLTLPLLMTMLVVDATAQTRPSAQPPQVAPIPAPQSSATPSQQDRCNAYVEQTVQPETFEAVVGGFGASVAPKGEYETTAQYQARLASAGLDRVRIIGREVESLNYFEYDADAGTLRVKSGAFGIVSLNFYLAFMEQTPQIEAGPRDNIAATISRRQRQTGSGAKPVTSRMTRETQAIFERSGRF